MWSILYLYLSGIKDLVYNTIVNFEVKIHSMRPQENKINYLFISSKIYKKIIT